MQVRARTPRIRVDIQGDSIPVELMDAIRKVVPEDEIEILEGDDEYVDWFDTDLHSEVEARTTPGEVMRIYRENRRWTQAELGEKLGGVSRQNVSHMEQGRRPISAATAIKLSRLYGIPVERVLRE